MSKEEEKKEESFKEIVTLPGKVTNKNVYLVKVEDITASTKKHKVFVTNKVDYLSSGCLAFIGYEVNNSSIAELKTYEDAIRLANKNKSELYSITYSLQKLISVRNLTYRLKA